MEGHLGLFACITWRGRRRVGGGPPGSPGKSGMAPRLIWLFPLPTGFLNTRPADRNAGVGYQNAACLASAEPSLDTASTRGAQAYAC
jgi:hypothetical protein